MAKSHKMRKLGASGVGMPWEPSTVAVEVGNGVSKRAPAKAVGSALLRSLAARTWADVTAGAGVVLVAGKEVKTAR